MTNLKFSAVPTNTVLAEHADAIRLLGKQTVENIIEIGRRLVDCRDNHLVHGQWLPWLNREFGWSRQTADNFIHVYEARHKLPNFSNLKLPISSIYLLAAPSTPEPAKAEVIERAKTGEALPVSEIKRAIKKHKDREQPAKRHPTRVKMQKKMAAYQAELKKLGAVRQSAIDFVTKLLELDRGLVLELRELLSFGAETDLLLVIKTKIGADGNDVGAEASAETMKAKFAKLDDVQP